MRGKLKNKQFLADSALLFVTLCWGISYSLTKICLTEVGPFTLNAFRFLLAFLAAVVFMFKRFKDVSFESVKYSFLISIFLFIVYVGCTYGVLYTSISNAGFLCALPVLFTPMLAFIFKGEKPKKKFVLVVVMSVAGIGFLSLQEDLSFAAGDLLCIMAALAYAIDLLITETAVQKEEVNALHIGIFQLLFTGLFCLTAAFVLEDVILPVKGGILMSMIFLAIMCTGIAFIVQAVAQQYTPASHVGVIFTLEPVFSSIVAFILFNEVLSIRGYFGATLLILSLIIMEINIPMRKKNIKN